MTTPETSVSAPQPAHGGCFHCASLTFPVLISTYAPGQKAAPSVGLCPPCRDQHAPGGHYQPPAVH